MTHPDAAGITADEASAYYDSLFKAIDTISNEQLRDQLSRLIDAYGNELILAPASPQLALGGCYPGGWLQHAVESLRAVYKIKGAIGPDMSIDGLILCVIGSLLGKLGQPESPYYELNTEDWKIRSGNLYTARPAYKDIPLGDLSLYILQKKGIELSMVQWQSIKNYQGQSIEKDKMSLFGQIVQLAIFTGFQTLKK